MRNRFLTVCTVFVLAAVISDATARPGGPPKRSSRLPEIIAPTATPQPPVLMAARVPAPGQVDDTVRAAADYVMFQRAIAQMAQVQLNGAAPLETAITATSHADPVRGARGLVPYLSLVGAQEPAFVDGVRRAARLYGDNDLIRAFQTDIGYAAKIPGAEAALRVIAATLERDATLLAQTGGRYTREAYTIQKSSWSQALSPKDRSKTLKAGSVTSVRPDAQMLDALAAPNVIGSAELSVAPARTAQFWAAVGYDKPMARPDLSGLTPKQATLAYTALSLSALRVLNGQAGTWMAQPAVLQSCMEVARLQLYQCVSAGRYKYEEPFCIGRHALNDPARCMGAS